MFIVFFKKTINILENIKEKMANVYMCYKETTSNNSTDFFRLEQIKLVADKIRNNDLETFVAFDAKGNVVFNKTGDKDSVKFLPEERQNIIKADISIHNHPSGPSFSVNDILLMANTHHSIMYVCSKQYDYKLEFDWNELKKDFKNDDEFKVNLEHELKSWNTKIFDMQSDLIRENKISVETAQNRHNHLVLKNVVKNFNGIKYYIRIKKHG